MRNLDQFLSIGLSAVLCACTINSVAFAQVVLKAPSGTGSAQHTGNAQHKVSQAKPVEKKAEATNPAQRPAPAESPRDVTSRFGNWTVNCARKKEPSEPSNCVALIPVARDKDDQRRVIIMGVTKRADAYTFFTHTPTSVDIKPGVDVQFEGRAVRHFDYSSCEAPLCSVATSLDNGLLDELLNVQTVSVSWAGLNMGPIKITFPTTGAREALEYLRVQ